MTKFLFDEVLVLPQGAPIPTFSFSNTSRVLLVKVAT